MNADRHQTVTKTGSLEGPPRKSRSFNPLRMRRVGIEPTTYEFKGGHNLQLIRLLPGRIISRIVRLARKARETVLTDRNASVIANQRIGQFELSIRAIEREREQRAMDLAWRSSTWPKVLGG